jgi:GrpB-like predicted nucleotidyltransferase (UPF0157 family)
MQTVVMVDYDPEWPVRFERLRRQIETALGKLVIRVEHVGSTSVPGMCAKPIVDFDVVVRPEDLQATVAAVEALGYRHEGGVGPDEREATRWTAHAPAEHHLYICPLGSSAFERHILMRDFLRAHPEKAREYAELKQRLAAEFHENRTKYQEAKASFVDSLIAQARRERDEKQ